MTVVLGENDTGKSCLIKSIYSAFGADPAKTNESWTNVKASLLMEFSIDGVPYRILRS
jgi:predicted ATPase